MRISDQSFVLLGLFFCFCISQIFGLEYGIDAKREGTDKIKRLHIFSERCTGSFYVNDLLKNNLPLDSAGYGHKHFPPWFDLPVDEFKGPHNLYNFDDSDDTLFVVIFRNPYAWLKSMHRTPHHASKSLHHIPVSEFIKKPWILRDTDPVVIKERELNPYLDCDPFTKQPFENVIKLRTAKVRNMLMIKNKVKNIYFLNYEKARDFPIEIVKEVADIYGLVQNPVFKPVVFYKADQKQGVYKPKKSSPLSYDDLLFINQQLDKDLEELIGYKLIYLPVEQLSLKNNPGNRYY